MTDKELSLRRQEIRNIRANNDSDAFEVELTELSCRDMINSILAYNVPRTYTAEQILEREEHSYHNYLEDYVKKLGREKVLALIEEQKNDIKEIRRDVFTDSEGVSYNSIVWVR